MKPPPLSPLSPLSPVKNPVRQDIWRGHLGVLALEYAIVIDHAAHMVIFGPCDGDNWKPGAIPMLTPDEATTLGSAFEKAGLKLKGIFTPAPVQNDLPVRQEHREPMSTAEHTRFKHGRWAETAKV